MTYDVITIGSATVDTFVSAESELIKIESRNSKEEFLAFPLGGKVLINHTNSTTGGGGTNTAVAFSRLGLKTAFLGKIGNDSNGEYITNKLKDEGIDFIGPVAKENQSGFSFIMNSLRRDRTILTYKGVNDTLGFDEVPELNTKWIYSSSMMGESYETIVKIAQNTDAKFAFNPSSYQAKQGYEALKDLIDHLDVIVMNKEEVCELIGLNAGDTRDISELALLMQHMTPKYIMITNGEDGTYVWDREKFYHARPSEDVQVVETTGAGDSMAAGFVAGLAMGKCTEEALKLGMSNCEAVIAQQGAKQGLISKAQAIELVANDTREITSKVIG
jgi:ribokinase